MFGESSGTKFHLHIGWRKTGGGGYSQKIWIGVCGPLPKTLTPFMTKICDFPYPIYDLTLLVAGFIQPAQQALNEVEEGKARMGEEGRDEELASSK